MTSKANAIPVEKISRVISLTYMYAEDAQANQRGKLLHIM
jgi:hypothetical protein